MMTQSGSLKTLSLKWKHLTIQNIFQIPERKIYSQRKSIKVRCGVLSLGCHPRYLRSIGSTFGKLCENYMYLKSVVILTGRQTDIETNPVVVTLGLSLSDIYVIYKLYCYRNICSWLTKLNWGEFFHAVLLFLCGWWRTNTQHKVHARKSIIAFIMMFDDGLWRLSLIGADVSLFY